MNKKSQEWNDENIRKINITFTPLTRELVLRYVTNEFQGDAETSDDALMEVFIGLHEDNELARLFIGEWFETKEWATLEE